jgi:L-lactate dehydrogenase complex protein LldG
MDESTTREKVLKKIRNALINKVESPFQNIDFESSVMPAFTDEPEITFAEEFTRADGMFVYCENEEQLVDNLNAFVSSRGLLPVFVVDEKIKYYLDQANVPYLSDTDEFLKAHTGITFCEALVARTGTIVMSSRMESGRKLMVYPEVHIVIAFASQVFGELKDAIRHIRLRYQDNLPSLISFITGPSRTADIEKTLVKGAHGPRDLYLFFVDEI